MSGYIKNGRFCCLWITMAVVLWPHHCEIPSSQQHFILATTWWRNHSGIQAKILSEVNGICINPYWHLCIWHCPLKTENSVKWFKVVWIRCQSEPWRSVFRILVSSGMVPMQMMKWMGYITQKTAVNFWTSKWYSCWHDGWKACGN